MISRRQERSCFYIGAFLCFAATFSFCAVSCSANSPSSSIPPGSAQPQAVAASTSAVSTPPAPASPLLPAADTPSGTLVVQPTDKTPPDVVLPSPIPLGRGFLISGAVDARYQNQDTGRHDQTWLNETELDINHPLTKHGDATGNIFIQLIAEDPQNAPNRRDVLPGEAYLLYKLPFGSSVDSTVYLKAGQFQLPFGLLAVYDPHLQILQPLYSQSLGLRTDFGLDISGRFYGYLNYDFALTSGAGPDQVDNPLRVATVRLGRTFVTTHGVVNVGGSLLSGKLPSTDLEVSTPYAVELPPSGYVRDYRSIGLVDKSRIAGDGTWIYQRVIARGEIVAGADEVQKVFGYYVEGNYRFLPRLTATGAQALWNYATGHSNSSRNALGLTYASSSNLTFRALYEYLRDAPPSLGGLVHHQVTLQMLLQF